MKNLLARFVKDESGATAIEYGLIAAGIALIAWSGTVSSVFPLPLPLVSIVALAALVAIPALPSRFAVALTAVVALAVLVIARPVGGEWRSVHRDVVPSAALTSGRISAVSISGANLTQFGEGSIVGKLQLLDRRGLGFERDIRVGFFGPGFLDFSQPFNQPLDRGFIARWRPIKKDPKAAMSNIFFQATTGGESAAALRKKFLDACKADGQTWCLVVKQMDNPALGLQRQDDFADVLMAAGGGDGSRVPLRVARVYVADGHEDEQRILTGGCSRGH